MKTYTIMGEGKPPATFPSDICTSSYASAMTQHNLQPSGPVAFNPYTANTIHPGRLLLSSQRLYRRFSYICSLILPRASAGNIQSDSFLVSGARNCLLRCGTSRTRPHRGMLILQTLCKLRARMGDIGLTYDKIVRA